MRGELVANETARPGLAHFRPGWPLKTWLILAAMVIPVLGGGVYMAVGAQRQTKSDAAIARLAAENAGTPIEVFTGPDHTVYHSAAALPSSASPRADDKPTLAWFTNTNCGRCEDMKFAHTVAAEFRGRLVFIEKATDRDTAAATLGVTAVPAFVLLDARGREMGRFGFQPDSVSLRAAITNALVGMSRP